MSTVAELLTQLRAQFRAGSHRWSGDPGSGMCSLSTRRGSGSQAVTLALAQCAAGSMLLLDPRRVGALSASPLRVPPAPWVVRLLGGRLVGQGAVVIARPSGRAAVIGAVVDAAHAATMLAVAAVSTRYRRPALISAFVAGACAAAQLRARNGRPAR